MSTRYQSHTHNTSQPCAELASKTWQPGSAVAPSPAPTVKTIRPTPLLSPPLSSGSDGPQNPAVIVAVAAGSWRGRCGFLAGCPAVKQLLTALQMQQRRNGDLLPLTAVGTIRNRYGANDAKCVQMHNGIHARVADTRSASSDTTRLG
jgi:hypothetical protein